MEACLSVEREVNKVLDKFVHLQSSNEKTLSEIQLILRSAKNELQCEGNFWLFSMSHDVNTLILHSFCILY